jgi:integrase
MIAELSRGNAATGAETVGDLLERFLDDAQSKGRSPTTLREYKRIADKVLGPVLGRIKLSRLTIYDLDQLYAKLTAKGLKATTIRRVHALIGVALHQGVRWELVNRNVSLQANPPALHASEIIAPDPEERRVMQAAEAIDPTLGALPVLAALTGARRGELCGLRWADIDWEAGSLRIARSIHEVAGGGWSEKAIKAHGDALGPNRYRHIHGGAARYPTLR